MTNANHKVFMETVGLGIALLEGGNGVIQKSLYSRLTCDKNSEKFFKVFFDRMTSAQNEIKSTVIPSTGEAISRSAWAKTVAKEHEAAGKSHSYNETLYGYSF